MSTRVLLHTDAQQVGGAERALAHLAAALHPDLDVVVAGPSADVVEQVARGRPGAARRLVPAPSRRGDVRGLLAVRRALGGAGADVLHLNLSWAGSSPLQTAAAVSLRGPRVVAVEQLSLAVGSARARRVKRLLSARLDAHVAVGERAAREAERDNGLPPGSVRVVHNGVPDRGTVGRRGRTGAPVVGTLARFVPQKGLDVLLRALPALPDVRVLLVGSGPEGPALRRLAEELGVAGRVELRDWAPDPMPVLAELDVFVLPSRYEGFPLSVVEAMLAGVPVVATDAGSTREAVDAATGRLVPADDPGALAAALADALADPGRTVGAARARAVERFTDVAMARGFEQVYADVLGRPVGRAVPFSARAAAPPGR